MWHGQFLLLPKLKPERPADVRAMVSRHGDAEIIGSVLKRFGMELIRGAGAGKRRRNRGGATAVRECLRRARLGGDRRHDRRRAARTGAQSRQWHRHAGGDVGTAHCAVRHRHRRFLTLPTWSAFTLNLPFSTLAIVVGDPVRLAGEDAVSSRPGASRRALWPK